jgi:predicted transcriptional regulator
MAKVILNIRIDEELRDKLRVIAKQQNRSLSNLVETALALYVEQRQRHIQIKRDD